MPMPLGPEGTSPIPLPNRIASAITTEPPAVEALLMVTDPSAGERPAAKW